MSVAFLPVVSIVLAILAYLGATILAGVIAWKCRAALTAILAEKDTAGSDGFQPPASFSRLTGMVGAAALIAYLWGYGLILLCSLFEVITAPLGTRGTALSLIEKLQLMSAQSDMFVYVGLALFAPYAANQLSRLVSNRAADAGTSAPAQTNALLAPNPPPKDI